MLAILLVTLAASPEPSLPAPRFVSLPTPKFATVEGAVCEQTATEWVVKLNGRTFTVGKSVDRETAVRLAKEVAGEKVGTPSPVLPSIQSLMTPTMFPGNCPNGQCPNVAPARRGR